MTLDIPPWPCVQRARSSPTYVGTKGKMPSLTLTSLQYSMHSANIDGTRSTWAGAVEAVKIQGFLQGYHVLGTLQLWTCHSCRGFVGLRR